MRMQYSDHLARKTTQFHNAKNIPRPVMVPQAVTLANLSPVTWMAGNGQHALNNASLDLVPNATALKYGQLDPAFATWHIRDYLVT